MQRFLGSCALIFGLAVSVHSEVLQEYSPPTTGAALTPASGCFGPSCSLDENSVLKSSGGFVVQSTGSTAGIGVLRVKDYSGTELMRIQQNGQMVVGATAPCSTCTVQIMGGTTIIGAVDVSGTFTPRNGIAGHFLTGALNMNGKQLTNVGTGSAGSVDINRIGTGYGIFFPSDGGVGFSAAGTEYARFVSPSLGIGTSAPCSTCTVHIIGNIATTGNLSCSSRTKAQLEAETPTDVGQCHYCSNCSNSVRMVVSTGAAICQYDSFIGGTAWH